jgi:CBS domain-containing protein
MSVAVHRFVESEVRSLVVMDNEQRVSGVLSVRDLLRSIEGHGAGALDEPVAQAMTTDFASVTPDVPLEEAERIFLEKHIHHLPVVEDDRLVGMVTPADVLGGHLGDVQFLNDNLIRYVYSGG